jgi:hypothetical protein
MKKKQEDKKESTRASGRTSALYPFLMSGPLFFYLKTVLFFGRNDSEIIVSSGFFS